MISAAIAVAASALFFLNHRATPGHDLTDLVRLAMLAITAIGNRRHHRPAAETIDGCFRVAAQASFDRGTPVGGARPGRRHRHRAARFRHTRAEFINRAFRDYFSLPDAKADSKPPFIALMYHGRDTGAYELPEAELSAFIARRTEMMRSGDSTPINIKLADGKVLRFSCTALSDGGRMLSYTPVTDLVRHTDHASNADYHRSLRTSGEHGLVRHLRAVE